MYFVAEQVVAVELIHAFKQWSDIPCGDLRLGSFFWTDDALTASLTSGGEVPLNPGGADITFIWIDDAEHWPWSRIARIHHAPVGAPRSLSGRPLERNELNARPGTASWRTSCGQRTSNSPLTRGAP
jgi:hypothetical protein